MRSLFALLASCYGAFGANSHATQDCHLDEPSRDTIRNMIEDDEFISFARIFLSVLAAAKGEDLQTLCSRVLPHRLCFDQAPPMWAGCSEAPEAREVPQDGLSSHDPALSEQNEISGSTQLPHMHPLSPASDNTFDQDLVRQFTALANPRSTDGHISATVDVRHHEEIPLVVGMSVGACGAQHPRASALPNVNVNSDAGESGLTCNLTLPSTARQASPFALGWQRIHSASTASFPLEGSSSPYILHEEPFVAECARSRLLRAFAILTDAYGASAEHDLKAATIIEIFRLGDSFLRTDLGYFIKTLHLTWVQDGFWGRSQLTNPSCGDTVKSKLLMSLHCAEILEGGSVVDPVRLRIARVVLYHCFERLRTDSAARRTKRCSRGRNKACIATDQILEQIYPPQKDEVNLQTWRQRRERLKRHKKIGKRGASLAACLGPGILLSCHAIVQAQINEIKFSEGMIAALLTYILNAYPQGVKVSQMLDPLAKRMLAGELLPSQWPDEGVMARAVEYAQQNEKETFDFSDDWSLAKLPRGFIKIY